MQPRLGDILTVEQLHTTLQQLKSLEDMLCKSKESVVAFSNELSGLKKLILEEDVDHKQESLVEKKIANMKRCEKDYNRMKSALQD